MINRLAMQILNRSEATLHVTADLPSGERIVVRVLGVGSKVCGIRMDNGQLQEDILLDWIAEVSAT